jgi:hypothetical protein
MRRTLAVVALLITVATVSAALTGNANGNKPSSINVTSIYYDTDTLGNPLLIRSDDYNGYRQASYTGGYIFTDGRYFLRLYGQSVRTIYVDSTKPIGSQPMPPPAGYYWQNMEIVVACYDQNLNLVPLPNILTLSTNCRLLVDFGYNGTEYALVMGPAGTLPAAGPNPGLVTVTCNSVASNQCVNWTVTPNMTSSATNPPTVADLFVFTGNHRTPIAFYGQYNSTFRFDITNP